MISGGAGFLLPMLVNFLATPFLLKNLGDEAFGLQTFVNVILGYLLVADMGMDVPIVKYLAEFTAKKNFLNRNKLLNNTLQIYLLIGLVGMIIIIAAEPFMYSLFNIPDSLKTEARYVFWLAGFGFFWNIICVWGKAVFSGIQRLDIGNGIFIVVSLISTFSGLLLVYNGLGVVSFVFAKVFGFCLSAIIYIIVGRRIITDFRFSLGFDKWLLNIIKPLIGYGVLMRISGMIFGRLDQSFIGAWVGIAAVGLYSIPLMICSAITGLISGVMSYTLPKVSELFSMNNRDDLKSLYIGSVKLATLSGILMFSLLIGFGRQFISLWISPEVASSTYVPLLILSVASIIQLSVNSITNNYLVAMDGMKFFAINSFIRGFITMVGFFFFIKSYGIIGAALGVLVTSMYDILFLLIALKKFIRVSALDLVMRSILKPVIVGLLSAVVLYLLREWASNWTGLILSGLIYTVFFSLMVILVKVFDEKELNRFLNLFSRSKPI
jgi:O-antigen/teichoic acid export membrane protein